MKIAIYSHSFAPSIDGVCRRFTGILHELEKQGHQTLVFTLEDKPEDLPKSTIVVTVDHMIFPSYPNKKVARPTCRAIWRISNALKSFRPDIIHVVADGYSNLFTLAGLVFKIPVVGSFHSDILDLLTTHKALAFQKFLVATKEQIDSYVFDSCATTSESFKAKLITQGVHCEHVIITAVDIELFNKDKRKEEIRSKLMFGDTDGFLCVYVGRISHEKRLDVVIKAMSLLTGNQKAYLAIVGDGPSSGDYARLHGAEHRIYCKPEFLGHVELADIYASSELHVSASEFETLGNTVLEAHACSIPVVVPRTQGFVNTVAHEKDGFLFEPMNSQDCAKYMQRLKDDDALRHRLGDAGRRGVESDKSISFVVRDIFKWYEKGTQNFKAKSAFKSLVSFSTVTFFLALTVFMFFWYDIGVNYFFKPFISYTKKAAVGDVNKEH